MKLYEAGITSSVGTTNWTGLTTWEKDAFDAEYTFQRLGYYQNLVVREVPDTRTAQERNFDAELGYHAAVARTLKERSTHNEQ